jgi:hypothetical protein
MTLTESAALLQHRQVHVMVIDGALGRHTTSIGSTS